MYNGKIDGNIGARVGGEKMFRGIHFSGNGSCDSLASTMGSKSLKSLKSLVNQACSEEQLCDTIINKRYQEFHEYIEVPHHIIPSETIHTVDRNYIASFVPRSWFNEEGHEFMFREINARNILLFIFGVLFVVSMSFMLITMVQRRRNERRRLNGSSENRRLNSRFDGNERLRGRRLSPEEIELN